MSFASERTIIEERLADFWLDTPVSYGNIAFKEPNNKPWIRLNIINGATVYRAINYAKRYNGIINVQIFVPVKTGTNLQREYADVVVSMFESARFESVVCDTASVTTVGADAKWHQVNVDIPYWRDSV